MPHLVVGEARLGHAGEGGEKGHSNQPDGGGGSGSGGLVDAEGGKGETRACVASSCPGRRWSADSSRGRMQPWLMPVLVLSQHWPRDLLAK